MKFLLTLFTVIFVVSCALQKTNEVSTKNNSGALYGLLEPLSKHNVSMTRIESRPSKHNNWEYLFYLDLDGHIQDEPLRKANNEIKKHASLYRFLGSYPAAIRK